MAWCEAGGLQRFASSRYAGGVFSNGQARVLFHTAGMVFAPATRAVQGLSADVRGYRVSTLRGDLFAGLTVAMVAVPQSMAFANIAGVPEVYGLYTAIIGAVVGGLLTSSRYLAPGPTNTAAILTAGSLGAAASLPGLSVIQVAVMLALLVGVIQIFFAFARLGELVRYVSRSVIIGFSAGAGVLIAIKQIAPLLGMNTRDVQSTWHGLFAVIHELTHTASQPNWHPMLVGGVSLLVLWVCRGLPRWVPGYLLAVVAGAVAVVVSGWTSAELRLVGELPRGLPPAVAPPLRLDAWRALLTPAFAIALVGMIEVVSISKTLAARSGDRIDANREFLNLGVTNTVGSFFQCIPSSGSFSRSALNADSGARSRFACILGGVLVAVIFLTLAPAARYIPMASIAVLLIVIGLKLIDVAYFRRLLASNKADLLVCVGTLAATLTFPLEWAVLVGVFLNIGLYLRRARQVLMTEIVPQGDGFSGVDEADPPNAGVTGVRREREVALFQLEGNLFFASADELQDRFLELLQGPAKAVILRLKRTHAVDASVMYTIEQFVLQMHERDRFVLLCGVRPRMRERMARFGLIGTIPEDHVVETQEDLFSSTKMAVARAHALVKGEALPTAAMANAAQPSPPPTLSPPPSPTPSPTPSPPPATSSALPTEWDYQI